MDSNDSKVPIYIAILVAVILVAAGSYFVLGGPSKPTKEDVTSTLPTPTDTATVEPTTTTSTAPTPTPTSSNITTTATQAVTVKCELCHTDPQNYPPHVNGGKLCINCHGSQVHNIHIGPGTVGLDCQTCHGFPPTIPSVENGTGPGHYAVCEKCHAPPPDSLKPSNGNLIVIHLSRGKYCTNCHGADIKAIHATALANLTTQ